MAKYFVILYPVNETKVIIKLKKDMSLAEKLKEKRTTPYKEIAEKVGVTPQYVGKIARGQRIPKHRGGKAMKVLCELEKMCDEIN